MRILRYGEGDSRTAFVDTYTHLNDYSVRLTDNGTTIQTEYCVQELSLRRPRDNIIVNTCEPPSLPGCCPDGEIMYSLHQSSTRTLYIPSHVRKLHRSHPYISASIVP